MNKSMLVIHCADTYPDMNITAAEIDQWHRDRGWDAIGYNLVIRRCGTLELGRDLDGDWDVIEEIGAHAAGFNSKAVGLCLVGGKSRENNKAEANFTKDQMITLKSIVGTLRALIPGLEVLGHRDLPDVTKECPSFDVRRWLETGEVI